MDILVLTMLWQCSTAATSLSRARTEKSMGKLGGRRKSGRDVRRKEVPRVRGRISALSAEP